MSRRWIPQPSERAAWKYRRAHETRDLEPSGRYERSGFYAPDGFHGEYEERREYSTPRGVLYLPEPEGSGWPHPVHTLPREALQRHRRALRDRELARAVDSALYGVMPAAEANRISVYAADAVITLAGPVTHPLTARVASETAWRVPGVRHVRNRLVRRPGGAQRRRGRGRPSLGGRV